VEAVQQDIRSFDFSFQRKSSITLHVEADISAVEANFEYNRWRGPSISPNFDETSAAGEPESGAAR
jgi:hypothetical protein